MASLFTNIVPRWFFKRTDHYIKEHRNRIPESQARKARCRGDVRAAERRMAREKTARWRQANEAALPFRMKIVAKIEEAKAKLREEVLGRRKVKAA